MSVSIRENANRIRDAVPKAGQFIAEALEALEGQAQQLEDAVAAGTGGGGTGGITIADIVEIISYDLGTVNLSIPGPAGSPAFYVVRVKVTSSTPGVLTFPLNFKFSTFQIDEAVDTYAIISFYLDDSGFYWPMALGVNGFIP